MEKQYSYCQLIMSVGFGKSTNNASSIIKSLKKSYVFDQEYLQRARQEWNADYPYRIHERFSEEDLFEPREYSYIGASDLTQTLWNPDSPSYSNRKKCMCVKLLYLVFGN